MFTPRSRQSALLAPSRSLQRRGKTYATRSGAMKEDSPDRARALVLSPKPRFAEAILDGAKTVEVRRLMPRITVPALALLYASGSERALVGTSAV